MMNDFKLDESQSILELFDINKSFGSVRVLRGVNLDLARGEVHAIVGENGAGKSTLMHILTGSQRPDSGSIILDGVSRTAWESEIEALEAGVSIVYQERSLFGHLSIAENIFAGRPPIYGEPTRNDPAHSSHKSRMSLGRIDFSKMHAQSQMLLADVGLLRSSETLVSDLSQAEQQQVEIAKALSLDAKVLILDEPTACLSHAEVERLFDCIAKLKSRQVTILFITHRLEEVFAIAARVTVLKDGVIQQTFKTRETNPQQLVSLMVGRPWDASTRRSTTGYRDAAPLMQVESLEDSGADGLLRSIAFEIRAGEIVGLAGLVGAGRSEIALSLFGARHPVRSSIQFDGKPYIPKSPSDAIERGIALVAEDRRAMGMFPRLSLADNLVSASRNRFGGWLWNHREAKHATLVTVRQFRVVCRDIDQPLLELSGGNQQKIMLARWLLNAPKLLILDEPTRGVDVAAKDEIHEWIKRLADRGIAVLVISSDLTEVLSLSDTIVVVRQGRCVGQCDGTDATERQVMEMASIGGANSVARVEPQTPSLSPRSGASSAKPIC